MSSSSKKRWCIQWAMVLFAIPVGGLLFELLVHELPQEVPFINWFYKVALLPLFFHKAVIRRNRCCQSRNKCCRILTSQWKMLQISSFT